MSDSDLLQRFLFEKSDTRGEIITLEKSYRDTLSKTKHPAELANLIGEFLAAVGLLSATLKFDGIITLQARGEGPVGLLIADCSQQRNLRATIQCSDKADLSSSDIRDLIGRNGHINIIIDNNKGERYQGIVPLDQPTLSGCLETYFSQSEQVSTRIWLAANGKCAGGLMIQALPQQISKNSRDAAAQWQHLVTLADTIKPQEQLNLSHNDQLYRLFHEEDLRLFEPQTLQFLCSCSRTRTEAMLRTLGPQELRKLIDEKGFIEVNCHFCQEVYQFTATDIDTLFDDNKPIIH